jgi:hypothetical protein
MWSQSPEKGDVGSKTTYRPLNEQTSLWMLGDTPTEPARRPMIGTRSMNHAPVSLSRCDRVSALSWPSIIRDLKGHSKAWLFNIVNNVPYLIFNIVNKVPYSTTPTGRATDMPERLVSIGFRSTASCIHRFPLSTGLPGYSERVGIS